MALTGTHVAGDPGMTDDDNLRDLALLARVSKGELVFNVKDYLAVGDDTADDTAEIQAAFDAAPAGAIVFFPVGTYKIATAISITKAVHIVGGSQYHTSVRAYGCNGFVTASGLGDVRITNLAITQAVYYTTTTNLFVGILVNGTSGAHPAYHVYEDVLVRGFETAIQTNFLWTSAFRNVHTSNGLIGIDAYGLSENNNVQGGNLVVGVGSQTRLAGSASIRLNGQVSRTDTTSDVSEGWIIDGVLMYGGDYGVQAFGYANYQIVNSILDAIQISGVGIANNGTAYGGNALIQGNYIAMAINSVSTDAAIKVANTFAAIRGVKILGNDLLVYTGGSVTYGVWVIADASSTALVEGNTIQGFTTNDIKFSSSNNTALGNRCLSPGTTPNFNLYSDSGQINLISDNIGSVFVSSATIPNQYSVSGGFKVCRAADAPTAGAWIIGDRVVNSIPAVGSPKAWACTVAGTPGTWVSEGNL